MEIVIEDKKVAKIINNDNTLIRTIGVQYAKPLKKRIKELMASENFFEYKAMNLGKPHPLEGNMDDCYGIHLTDNIRLVIKPLCTELSNEGLKKCKKIDIKGVLEYHDGKNEWKIP